VADAFRPPTLLLGAICLWALLLLILAMAGLGSRFSTATNAAKPPPIPLVSLTRSQSRLGPIADYLEVGQRPLMTADRRPAPVLAVDGQAGAADLDVMLTSVLMTSKLQLAILTSNTDATSYRVRLGETVQGSNWRLVQLEPRKAVIEGPSGQRVLELRVFDGKGGEAPTPLAAATGSGVSRSDGASTNAQSPSSVPPSPPSQPTADVAAQPPTQVSQDQQVEAIRRRIEARRAQMRAEAAANGANEKQ